MVFSFFRSGQRSLTLVLLFGAALLLLPGRSLRAQVYYGDGNYGVANLPLTGGTPGVGSYPPNPYKPNESCVRVDELRTSKEVTVQYDPDHYNFGGWRSNMKFGYDNSNPNDGKLFMLFIVHDPDQANQQNMQIKEIESISQPSNGTFTIKTVNTFPTSGTAFGQNLTNKVVMGYEVPQFNGFVLGNGGTITCDPYEPVGSSQLHGGVVCMLVNGSGMIIRNGGEIDVAQKGKDGYAGSTGANSLGSKQAWTALPPVPPLGSAAGGSRSGDALLVKDWTCINNIMSVADMYIRTQYV